MFVFYTFLFIPRIHTGLIGLAVDTDYLERDVGFPIPSIERCGSLQLFYLLVNEIFISRFFDSLHFSFFIDLKIFLNLK